MLNTSQAVSKGHLRKFIHTKVCTYKTRCQYSFAQHILAIPSQCYFTVTTRNAFNDEVDTVTATQYFIVVLNKLSQFKSVTMHKVTMTSNHLKFPFIFRKFFFYFICLLKPCIQQNHQLQHLVLRTHDRVNIGLQPQKKIIEILSSQLNSIYNSISLV